MARKEAVARKKPQGDFSYGGLEGMLPQKIMTSGVIHRNDRRQYPCGVAGGIRWLVASNETSVYSVIRHTGSGESTKEL